ncbi:hypothetical protein KW797_04100 [Candidatus Parcubacteria bacterium]|nr:hypothetical protein [Candidatus Parcubacteria bacterium]
MKKASDTVNTKTRYSRRRALWELGLTSLRELETEHGILASSRTEAYGCIFGRDSLITSLLLLGLLRRGTRRENEEFLALVRKALFTLSELQGKEVNIESGEEPGKCIHEWRPSGHEHLTVHGSPPWFVYPEGAMKNYDTVDATPLYLMAMHEYWSVSGDNEFIERHLPKIEMALMWLSTFGDANKDGFIDYGFQPGRTYGGLTTQSWMDSAESLFHEDGTAPSYPVAPVEVQAYAWSAFRRWGNFFAVSPAFHAPERASELTERAHELKRRFNASFVRSENGAASFPYGIDGEGRALTARRSSPGHILFAAYRDESAAPESILDAAHVPDLVRTLFSPDLFVRGAGLRTLSSASSRFEPGSYHNGSIWPHDTALAAAGLRELGYRREARKLSLALLSAFSHFGTPLELFTHADGAFGEYHSSGGQRACRVQAWSAAALLATIDALGAIPEGEPTPNLARSEVAQMLPA